MTTSTFAPSPTMGIPSIYGLQQQPGLEQVFGQQLAQQPFGQQPYGLQPYGYGQPWGQQAFGQAQPFGFADPSIVVTQLLPQLLWQAQHTLVATYQIVQVLQQLALQFGQQPSPQGFGIGGAARQFARPYGMAW